jgi:hypothetical protein
MEALMNDDTGEYLKLSKAMRAKLRIHGLIERKKVNTRWALKPTKLWEKIVKQNNRNIKTG